MIEDLVKEFVDKEAQVTEEENKAADAHSKYMDAATESLDSMKEDKEAKEEDKEKTLTEISDAQEQLLDLQAELKDNQVYMKDLTAQCELKAREWDQQTTMRAQEMKALNAALGILEEKVQPKEVVNERALLQTQKKGLAAKQESEPAVVDDDDVAGGFSFLQRRA